MTVYCIFQFRGDKQSYRQLYDIFKSEEVANEIAQQLNADLNKDDCVYYQVLEWAVK